MPTPKIAVVGSCNMDIYSWTDHLPEPGETVIGDRYLMVMGGKGANQAVAACRQGAQVSMIGRVGDDLFGQRMLDTLVSYEVDTSFVQVDHQTGSGVALVIVDKKPENIILVVPGTNMRIEPTDIDPAAERLHEADVLLLQMEIPLPTIEHALDISRQGKTFCILNPAPARPLPDQIFRKIDLITPNQNEAKVLTGIPADTVKGAEAAGKALIERGVPAVIITLGAQGALLVLPNETHHVEGLRIEDALDTTGAGDAFMGGLSVALAKGKSLQPAVRFANVVAALSTRRRGAMPSMPSREEVEVFIRDHNLESLVA
ncbi:MAG: ribokinase [Anaerolineales bacterium]